MNVQAQVNRRKLAGRDECDEMFSFRPESQEFVFKKLIDLCK